MRNILLKILAVLSFAAVMFPFMFSIDINTFGDISVLRMLFYVIVCVPVFGLGYLEAMIAKEHKKLRIPLRIIGLLAGAAGFSALLINGDLVTVFALGVCCIVVFFIGERACYKNFADMFPLSAFAFYIVLTIGCYIFAAAAAGDDIRDTALEVVSVAFAVEFAVAALLVNQSGIFERANMRKETRSSLPRGLTSYNAALVLGFTVTGLLLMIFRKYIAWLLRRIALIIIEGIFWLVQQFFAERMQTMPSENGTIGEGFIQENNGSIPLQAIGIAALIALVIIFRKQIFEVIKDVFAHLGALFGGRPEVSAEHEFTDVFEDFGVEKKKRYVPDTISSARKRYRSEKDPKLRYRYGYRVLLYRIKALDKRLSPADTVPVQAQRGAEYFGEADMSAAAEVYERVRYDDSVPTKEQLDSLDLLVEK